MQSSCLGPKIVTKERFAFVQLFQSSFSYLDHCTKQSDKQQMRSNFSTLVPIFRLPTTSERRPYPTTCINRIDFLVW